MNGVDTTAAPDTQPVLRVQSLGKSYPSRRGPVPAVGSVSFDVSAGEFVSVVGPSGCGKTTLMNLIAGLLPASTGSVAFAGQPVDGPREGVAVVFQDYSRSLFPWLSCAKNVALPLRDRGLSRAQITESVERCLGMVGLGHAGELYPWQLSGGMQQRIAIARGLATSPTLLIMDEPFASVDAQTRANLEDLLLDVWADTGTTVLFVTHDIDESVYLADRVVVLSQGPSVVASEVVVDLPRPRDQIGTKKLREFSELRAQVFEMVMASQARTSFAS